MSGSGAGGPASTSATIVMPVRNEGTFLRRSLAAVLSQNYPPGRIEVLVADGMSDDDTRAIVNEMMASHPHLRMLDNPARIVPVGMNRAIREARGEVIVRVDGHTIVAPDYVSQCLAALERSSADCVGGPMVSRGEGRFGEAVAAATSSRFGVGGARFHYSQGEEWVDTVYLGAWRRTTFDRIGLFDEEMVRDQDDELNYRLLDQGGRILLSPRIRSSYTVRGTPGSLWRQYFQYGFWKVRVAQKHPRQVRARQLAPPLFALSLVGSAALACTSPEAVHLWGSVPLAYGVVNLAASLAVASVAGWRILPWLPLAYATMHLAYGFGFLTGLVRFATRWRDGAGRRPIAAERRDPSA